MIHELQQEHSFLTSRVNGFDTEACRERANSFKNRMAVDSMCVWDVEQQLMRHTHCYCCPLDYNLLEVSHFAPYFPKTLTIFHST